MKGGLNIPTIVGSLPVVRFTRLDARHRPTGAGSHDAHLVGPSVTAYGLVICRATDPAGYFLFTCQDDWYPMYDTWHATIDEALRQAEFEYEGSISTWEEPPCA